jgi:cell division septation protein DedD
MDNKATTKRMIGAVVLVLVAALLLAWLLKGKNRDLQNANLNQPAETKTILGFPEVSTDANGKPILVPQDNGAPMAGATLEGNNAAQPQVIAVEPAPATNTAATAPAAGFAVRPTAPAPVESRQVVDTDGQVKSGLGNMGSNDTKAPSTASTTTTTDLTGTETQPLNLPSSESKATGSQAAESASSKDRPAASRNTVSAPEEKRSPRPVLVGEKPVPKATETPAKSMSAIEKAAAEKSLALAKAEKGEKASVVSTKDSETTTDGDYSIQLMASSDKAKAEEVRKSMTAEGYKVALVEAKVDGKAIYRVRVGDYPKKEDAAAAQAKMKERYTKNTYVQNSFVTR